MSGPSEFTERRFQDDLRVAALTDAQNAEGSYLKRLRDEFAASALSRGDAITPDHPATQALLAVRCYAMADAMMKARQA